MIRLLAFVLALLLLAGRIEPERGWLVTLTVLTGIAAFRPQYWNPLDLRPALDMRLAAFVISVLLLAGAVDPTRDWLIALAAVTGVATFMPRAFALDWGREAWWRRYGAGLSWLDSSERPSRRWERRWDRRRRRRFDPFGDEWS